MWPSRAQVLSRLVILKAQKKEVRDSGGDDSIRYSPTDGIISIIDDSDEGRMIIGCSDASS